VAWSRHAGSAPGGRHEACYLLFMAIRLRRIAMPPNA